MYYRLGLNGLLNPPTRFIYCLYSVFFSFRTPYTLLPFTFVFFVDLNPVKPIARRISAISGSESRSISSLEGLGAVPLVGLEDGGGEGEGRGAFCEERGPVGGAVGRGGCLGGGLMDLGGLEERGGVRVRVRVEVGSLRGEADRLRVRLDGGSSGRGVSISVHVEVDAMHSPRLGLCLCLLLLLSLSLLSLTPFRSPSRCRLLSLSRE